MSEGGGLLDWVLALAIGVENARHECMAEALLRKLPWWATSQRPQAVRGRAAFQALCRLCWLLAG
jgi:hypothetical protein